MVGGPRSDLESRIEGVAESVAEEIDGQHRDEYARAGVNRKPRLAPDVTLRVRQHVSPRRYRWVDAEAEERQRGLEDDAVAEAQGGRDDDRRERVRDHV